MVECTTCGFDITVQENVGVGEIISCEQCGKEFEVKSLKPLQLVDAPEVDEDFGE
jgi:alpha-aminoadipate/glutamate carrier protein LysW